MPRLDEIIYGQNAHHYFPKGNGGSLPQGKVYSASRSAYIYARAQLAGNRDITEIQMTHHYPSLPPTPFTGKLKTSSTARPRYPSCIRQGRMFRPKDGVSILLEFVSKKPVFLTNVYSRHYVE